MSQSISHSTSAKPQQLPWNDQQIEQVKGLRRAISTRQESQSVDRDVAPLMSELLARVDPITSSSSRPSSIASPKLQTTQAGVQLAEPTPQRLFQATHSARGKLADTIQGVQDEGSRQRLVGMLRVVDQHVQMKQEILFRVQDSKK